ncbi:hypothetical protein NQZ68_035061 [Dissostichus eleginoides]|nr:hypothetical protein NQZ68_035061 [Dissostichus eleginoides]
MYTWKGATAAPWRASQRGPAEQVTFKTWTLPQPVNTSQSNKRQGHSHKAASSSLINEENKRRIRDETNTIWKEAAATK